MLFELGAISVRKVIAHACHNVFVCLFVLFVCTYVYLLCAWFGLVFNCLILLFVTGLERAIINHINGV